MILQKIKQYGIIIAVIAVLGLVAFGFYKLWRFEKAQAERWERNFEQQTQQIRELDLTWREFRDLDDQRYDSLLKELKVSPRHVREINNIYHYYYDTTEVVINPEPVRYPNQIIYPFVDQNECFMIGGYMEVDSADLTPELTINQRKYTDEIIQVFYKKRGKILGFIPWRFENYQEVQSKCGENKVERINIVKKRD